VFWCLKGLFFVSYPALVETDSYNRQNIIAWVLAGGVAVAAQFTIFGLLLGKLMKI
jgi:hypothetical protein